MEWKERGGPLVTVIVPSYNSPDLFRALRSVLSQDYGSIQLILIDDGSARFSRDETEQFLRENSGENIKESLVLVNPENQGTVRALNRALRECCGKYIFNLAGDDCYYDDRVLSEWVQAFEETGAQVMTARREVCDENLERVWSIQPTPRQIRQIQTLSPQKLFEKISPVNFIFGCCTARTAESFRKYGYYDERYRLVEDHSANLKLLRSGAEMVFFDRIVVKYRGGGASSAGRFNHIYEQDANAILEYEILPFTKHPTLVQWKYQQWKKNHEAERQYQLRLERWRDCKPMHRLVWLWYRVCHPWQAMCRISDKIKRTMRKGRV